MSKTAPTTWRRTLAALAGLAVTFGGLTLVASPAQAETVGTLFVEPSTGDQDTFMVFETDAPCPEGTQAVKAFITGPGITDDGNNNLTGNTDYTILQNNSAGGKEVAAGATLKQVFQNYGLPQTATYDITVRCMSTNGVTLYGDFVGQIDIVATGGLNLTYSQASQAEETTTTLEVGPTDPVAAGTQSTLTATLTPSDAAGSVQFKRDGINFGAQVTVVDGAATFTGAVPQGNAQLTAVFTPSDTNLFTPSTSAPVSYLVVPKPVITGNPKVGQQLTCNVGTTAGTNDFAWLVGGTADGSQDSATVTVPRSWGGKKVACEVTTTKSGHSLTQDSDTVSVAAAPIKNTKLPTISGTPKVGRKLTCKPGSWTPKPTSFAYQWLRNGKKIKGATTSTYKLGRADKGRKVACKVTAKAPGVKAASAVSKAKAVA